VALVKIEEPAVEPLIKALKDKDSDVRMIAVLALVYNHRQRCEDED
jgi:HEAT repeat protein